MNETSHRKVKPFEFKIYYKTLVKSYMIHTFTKVLRLLWPGFLWVKKMLNGSI